MNNKVNSNGPEIRIYIACHKKTALPSNPLFIPTQSGSALATEILPGMQRDDVGDNISNKNPHYNELDIQYWAWKHSEADYVGLCHYRRYLYLGNQKFTNLTKDHRNQIEVPVLSPYTEKQYGLLDFDHMKEEISSYDVLIPKAYDISKVYTPHGEQKTVLQHWLAHDGALIKKKDIFLLMKLVQEKFPDIYPYMKEFMNNKYFYGYNMFIMKRNLFHEMCNFEFTVFEEMEQYIDYATYNEQESRIFGFMGEILSSSFFYYLAKSRKELKIRECQILYFDDTDVLNSIQPVKSRIPIVVNANDIPGYLLYPLVESIISHKSVGQKFEMIVINNHFNDFFKKYYADLYPDDITFRFINLTAYARRLNYPTWKISDNYLFALLPWILANFDCCYFLNWNLIIESSEAFQLSFSEDDLPVKGVKDIFIEGKLNSYRDDDVKYAKAIKQEHPYLDTYNLFNDGYLYLNLSDLRKLDFTGVCKRLSGIDKNLHDLPYIYVFNALFQNSISEVSQRYNCFIYANKAIDFYIHLASKALLSRYKSAKNQAIVKRYDLSAPVDSTDNEQFYIEYWSIINQSEFSNAFNMFYQNLIGGGYAPYAKFFVLIDKILPKGSRRREFTKAVVNKLLSL